MRRTWLLKNALKFTKEGHIEVGYRRSAGHAYLKANNGTEAVRLARSKPDIDLILMDVKMPEMDGYEATRQIREFNRDVVIIAQTAYALTGEKEKALAAGCDYYLAKPLKREDLFTLIQRVGEKK